MLKRPSGIEELDGLFIALHSDGRLGIYFREGVDMVMCAPSATDTQLTRENRMVREFYIPQCLGDQVSRGVWGSS